MKEKEITITPPEGYEIDKENSTFEKIIFKPIQKVDLSILNNTDWFYVELISQLTNKQEKYCAKGRILNEFLGPIWFVNITTPSDIFTHYSAGSYLAYPKHITFLRKCTNEETSYIKQKRPQWFRKTKWEDFGIINGHYNGNTIAISIEATNEASKRLWPTPELNDASKALCQLVRYRDDWNEGWVPNWKHGDLKHFIEFYEDVAWVSCGANHQKPLTFKTKELAESFMKEFKNLLETAKPLL